jgi:DNA polymerase-3 subunit alpha
MLAILPYLLRRFKGRCLLLELEEFSPSFALQSFTEESVVHQSWELTGVYLPAHPLEIYGKMLGSYLTDLSLRIKKLPEKSKIRAASLLILARLEKTKTGRRIGFLTLEDLSGQWEAMLLPEELARFAHLLRARSLLLIEGEVKEQKGERTVVVKELKALQIEGKAKLLLSDNIMAG